MQSPKAIEKFVKDCFELFELNYDSFFTSFDENTSFTTRWENEDKSINSSAVSHASMILGIRVETIYNTDYDEIFKILNNHIYVKYLKSFFQSYNFQTYYKPDTNPVDIFVSRIFDDDSGDLERQYVRYDTDEIKNRLKNTLSELDKIVPGTFHKGEDIENLNILASNFFHFKKATQFVSSFLDMYDNLFDLFLKALEQGLSESEKNEYNFLVSQFAFSHINYRKKYAYYENINEFKMLYPNICKENIQYYMSIHLPYSFEPWRCAEFINDKSLVKRYLERFPQHKSKMRQFALDATKIRCYFNWSDSKCFGEEYDESQYIYRLLKDENLTKDDYKYLIDINHGQERTKIYIDKTNQELSDDLETSKNVLAYCKPSKLGGIKVEYIKHNNPFDNAWIIQNYNTISRMKEQNYVVSKSFMLDYVIYGGGDNE